MINQPGYKQPATPDQHGLFIDVPREAKYDFDSKIDAGLKSEVDKLKQDIISGTVKVESANAPK